MSREYYECDADQIDRLAAEVMVRDEIIAEIADTLRSEGREDMVEFALATVARKYGMEISDIVVKGL